MIVVTLTIDFGPTGQPQVEKKVTVPEKSTVLDVLSNQLPTNTSRKYGMEHFVEGIDGVENDFVRDRGWRFEVNGLRSNIPAERYLVKDGDWIKWLYLAGSCAST
ncbi:MAG: DUF4430 domain-containing protein [Candidatus Binatia bacterium]